MTSPLAPCSEAEPKADKGIVKELYHFEEKGTWVENIAVRSSDGNLIVVLYDRPEIWELILHESKPEANLLWKGKDPARRTTGITEITKDIFAFVVVAKNGGYSVWTLEPSSKKAIEVIKNVEGAGQLNGLTKLSPTVCLAADTKKGCVWRLDLENPDKGQYAKVDVTMEGWPLTGLGINGVRYRDGFLYYTNTSKGYLARIAIDPISAEFKGSAEILVKDHLSLLGIDDFALGRSKDEFFVALGLPHSRIMRITLRGKEKPIEEVIASGTEGIFYPTSVQFGMTDGKKNTIYVTTSGNPLSLVGANWFKGGKVFAIELKV